RGDPRRARVPRAWRAPDVRAPRPRPGSAGARAARSAPGRGRERRAAGLAAAVVSRRLHEQLTIHELADHVPDEDVGLLDARRETARRHAQPPVDRARDAPAVAPGAP